MSLAEKRRLFSRENPPKTASNIRSSSRRKTQPVTLDDLARANQLILARLDGRSLESPSSILRDDNESFGFPERASEVSTPEASILKSPSSILRDDNESFGFPERASEVSTPEASILMQPRFRKNELTFMHPLAMNIGSQ
ncbi:hypothetical protein CSKR_200489 [Clonorchis sinensis]|uniref:Uncharacterized protein n=1 Tax=Clonorchis sinensis TaxID=79923 RepID=A0A8T1MDZ9_CLOSI|nr:hypothetical protein CSKR_200489 [Clonorchis sinensis]